MGVMVGAEMDVIAFLVCVAVVVIMGWNPMEGGDPLVTVGAIEVMLVWALAVEPLEIRLTAANKRMMLNTHLVSISIIC